LAERKRGCGLLIFVLLVLVGLLAGVAWLPLMQARAKWRAGQTAEAIRYAEEWSRLKLWRSQYHQLLAAAHLSDGHRADAQPYLDRMRDGWLWIPVVTKDEVAKRLFARGAYADFLAYDSASRERVESGRVVLYRAAAQAATGRIDEAEAALRGIDAGDVDAKTLAYLKRSVADRKRGTWAYVVDRNGAAVASYVLASGDIVAVNKDFESFIEKDEGKLTIESNARRLGVHDAIELTLDTKVQQAAMRALGGVRGALVAIDPKTNEVLAIASNRGGNLALEHQYEPGSVMKTLTAAAAFSHGVDVKGMFPYTCKGALPIDGRSFGDWREGGHGSLADFEEAMAQSCNVVFADLGLKTGRDQLMALHKRAGFDSELDLGLYKVALGKTVGDIFNNFETGFYAIGIEHESVTALHLAMLASMMANRGTLTTPRIYRARRSILGEAAGAPPKQATQQVLPRAAAEQVIKGMQAVVARPAGTGRRAAVQGMTLALKTGTAGHEANGFNSLIMGFAPVDGPKIAFAIIAEDAGPAEFAAAKIAHDFVAAVK
jgi:penicillin-binding protein A